MLEAAGSVSNELVTLITKGRYGLHAEGKVGLQQKRFFTRAIRQFAFGQFSRKETLISAQVQQLISWIKSEQDSGGKVVVNEKLKEIANTIIWTICSGVEFQKDKNSKMITLGIDFIKHLQTVIKSGLYIYPWIKHFAPVASGYTQFKRLCDEIYEYVQETFNERIRTGQTRERPECIVDAYIDKLQACQNKQSSFYGDSGWKHSITCIIALYVAGGDGTATMLNWIIFYLSAFPQVQQKLQKEIEKVTENQRDAKLSDEPNMPYTQAVILEALRFASIVPIGVTQELTDEITFHGYKLPKGLFLQPLLYHVHYDHLAIWGDPENFRPERFLHEGGNLKEFVLAFQPGKRTCPGQEIAKDILFLFVTKLFQKYTFEVDSASSKDAKEILEPVFDFTLEPKKLALVVIER